ncbi:unnamed protein product, partial [Polarella glacialis]
KYDVILERIDNLTKGFLDYNTTSFSIDALMYNELSGTFTIQEMYTELGQEGSWRQRLKYRESWTVSPYRDLSSIIPDVIFGLIIIRLLITETKELVPAVIGGFDSTMASWLFWNIIDWLAILGGFVIMGLWALIRLQVSGTLLPAILAYPTASLDAIVMQNQTYMTTDEISIIAPQEKLEEMLKNIYNIAEAISAIHKTFRSLAFFYMFVLMIKFFKSFNSNKRLEIVIGTLSSSAVDVAHFFIIFMSIFSSYAVAGMFMFGNQEEGYSTLLSSHFYTWQSYSKVTDFTNIIRSPLGEVVGFAWTLTYEGIVVRLLLTILAGIIFCAYSAKKAELGDPQTIPGQVREALQDLRDTKDFLKLKGLIFELEDEEFPAHTDELVTVKSLMKAFKKGGLSPENAEYLIRKASRHASMKQGDILLTLNGSLQLVSVIRTATEKTALLLTQLIALMFAHLESVRIVIGRVPFSRLVHARLGVRAVLELNRESRPLHVMFGVRGVRLDRKSRTGGSGSFALANTGMSASSRPAIKDVGRPDSQGAFGALPTPVVSPSRYSQASGSPSKDEKRRRGSFDAKFAVAGPSPLEQTLLALWAFSAEGRLGLQSLVGDGRDIWQTIPYLREAILVLECICCLELARMLVGSLRGNITLGLVLHYTRWFVFLGIMPRVGSHPANRIILLSWILTEVCRYPFYILGGRKAEILRYFAPVLTFPLGAGSEAWACVVALQGGELSSALRALAYLQLVINIPCALAYYPAMVSKAFKTLKGDTEGKEKKGTGSAAKDTGFLFPLDSKGTRSTASAGRSLIAQVMAVTGVGARAQHRMTRGSNECQAEKNWRFNYNRHFVKLVELGCESPEVALNQAKFGLKLAHETFQFLAPGASSDPVPLTALVSGMNPASFAYSTVRVSGPARTSSDGRAVLRMPFNGPYERGNTAAPAGGEVLQGEALKKQCYAWGSAGVIEPDTALRAAAVVDYFENGGNLEGHHFVVIGASSAMGPAEHLLALGAHVIGISRGGSSTSKKAWQRLFDVAAATPGALLEAPGSSEARDCVGADLLVQPAEIREWLLKTVSKLPPQDKVIIGNYTYLDGELHVKITLAADVLMASLLAVRPTAGVAFLGTPTDATLVPAAAHRAARESFQDFWRATGPFEALLRLLSLGSRLTPNARFPIKNRAELYFVLDGYSVAQGPNYALAKRLQHWRAMVAFSEGRVASTRVAPSTATDSVTHNRTFGWAYLGMPFFAPLEVFKQETTAALMTALLIADVVSTSDSPSAKDPKTSAAQTNPLELFASESAHGGVWRCAYKLDSLGEVCVLAHFAGGPRPCCWDGGLRRLSRLWVEEGAQNATEAEDAQPKAAPENRRLEPPGATAPTPPKQQHGTSESMRR